MTEYGYSVFQGKEGIPARVADKSEYSTREVLVYLYG
jgi:hypothetical protein